MSNSEQKVQTATDRVEEEIDDATRGLSLDEYIDFLVDMRERIALRHENAEGDKRRKERES